MKILITGVSGLLGSALAWSWRGRDTVLGTYHDHPVQFSGVETVKVEFSKAGDFSGVIGRFQPAVVVHCAALTDIDRCEREKGAADRSNIVATENIAEALGSSPAKLVYISTDAVFDGEKGNYTEADEPNPVNHYGRTKLAGERTALSRSGTLVLRTNIFGWNVADKKCLSEWILNSLDGGENIFGFADVFVSTIYTMELARVIRLCLEKGLSGIYHAASRDSVSKYDFARRLAQAFGHDPARVVKGSVAAGSLKVRRGKNLSLDTSRLEKALGECLPSVDDSIRRCRRDALEGLPRELKNAAIGNR